MRFLFLLLLLIPSFANAKFDFKVHFYPIANLIYQLDCVSQLKVSCSEETYKELWKNNFLKSAEDEIFVKEWARLFKRYQANVRFEESETESMTGRFNGVDLSKKLQIAASQSQSLKDYLERLDLLVMPKDKLEFEKIIRHFEPRFSKWWQAIALPKGTLFAKQTRALLKQSDMAKR
jgi:hypothetical protein